MTYKSDPVPLPTTGKFHILKKKYVYWYDETQRNKETRIMKDNRVLIGRLVPGDPTHLFPNEKYEKVFLKKESGKVLSFRAWLALLQMKPMVLTQQTLLLNKATGNTTTSFPLDDKIIDDLMQILRKTEVLPKDQNQQNYEGLIVFSNAPLSSKEEVSIKSELGKRTILINASGMNSAFAYRLCHRDGTILTKQEATNLEQQALNKGISSNGKELIRFLRDQGIDFDFIRCMAPDLEYNLRLDSDNGDLLTAALLLEANTMCEECTPVSFVIDRILQERDNTTLVTKRLFESLTVSNQDLPQVLPHRFKTILLNFLRGAEASRKWDGRDTVNSGFIIVTSKADALCLHMPTRNSISDYLFNNVFFETPSIKRHPEENRKLIFELDGEPCVYLFLQIRSKK